MQKDVNTIHRQLRNMLVDSRMVIGLSRGLDEKRNGKEPIPTNPTDPGTKIAENMVKNFKDSGHPIFRASGAFERGELKSKGGGKKSTHSNGSDENVELLHRTVIFSNQLSVYGVIADLGRDLSEDLGLRET